MDLLDLHNLIELAVAPFCFIALVIIGEMALDLGLVRQNHFNKRIGRPFAFIVYFGIAAMGASGGLILTSLIQFRMFPEPTIKALSVLLAPIIVGAVMYKYGVERVKRGYKISRFATFTGGALFAFSFALVRMLLLEYYFKL